MDNHWVKVPNPNEDRETSSPRPTIKSRVTKIDKVKEPGLNDKLYKISKKKRIETVTREQTPPPPIGEDPQVVVTAEEPVLEEPVSEEPISEEPIFDPPTRVLPTEDEYVPSLETLTEKAWASSEKKKSSSEKTVIVQLLLNLDFDINSDETAQSTDTLESILGNMTNLHAQEDFGLAVSGYKTDKLLTVNIEEDCIHDQVIDSVTKEKETTEMCMDTRVVR